MKNWIAFILILSGSTVLSQFKPISKSFTIKDTLAKNDISSDDPFLEMLDSLHEAQIFNKNPITYNVRDLNIHNFPLDSIPEYSDSILRLRLQDMCTYSPIEFTFNNKVKRCIKLYGENRRQMLSKVMGMSELYFPIFEEELERNDLPMELKYLPIIE